jgi:hypothetical protein
MCWLCRETDYNGSDLGGHPLILIERSLRRLSDDWRDQEAMTRIPAPRTRYEALRRGRRTLKLVTPLVQVGFLGLGLAIFLDQSRALLSDTQFTWGERRVMGIIALLALGGCGFAGWVVGRLIAVAAEMLDVMADSAEASWRTSDLMERHVVPALSRIARALEERETSGDRTSPKGKRP